MKSMKLLVEPEYFRFHIVGEHFVDCITTWAKEH